MLRITSEDIQKYKNEIKCKDDNLNLLTVKRMVKECFEGQLAWDDVNKFGNGRIILEQLTSEGHEVETTVDAALVIEFILVVRQISRIMMKLKQEFSEMKTEMENIGQLLRFNIVSSMVNCGNLFSILDANHTLLMIN